MTPSQDTRLSKECELEDLLSLSRPRNISDYQRIAQLSVDLGRKEGREWDKKDEAELEALLAQYESLRKESLQTINNRVQILMLGIAAIGALVGGSLSIGNPLASRNIIYAIFSGAIPLISIFVLFVWTGEAMRSSRVGYFLAADIEATVNQKLGRFIMNWETNLWAGTQKRDEMWGPSMMAFVIIAIIAFVSPWCGLLLIGINRVARIWLVVAVPYLFLIGAAIYLGMKLKRLRNIPVVGSVFFKKSVNETESEKKNRKRTIKK